MESSTSHQTSETSDHFTISLYWQEGGTLSRRATGLISPIPLSRPVGRYLLPIVKVIRKEIRDEKYETLVDNGRHKKWRRRSIVVWSDIKKYE